MLRCLGLGLVFVAAGACSTVIAGEPLAIVEHVAAHREANAVSSIPWGAYAAAAADPAELRSLPIGVFDSGIGGLTVLEAILKLDQHHNDTGAPGGDGLPDFQGERFIYLGDQANMPYGNYPSAGRVDFLRELIVRDALFLLGDRFDAPASTKELQKQMKPPVKAIVIACNTATAYGLDDIRAALERWKIPVLVVGVVEAGGRGVIDAMRQDTTQGAAAVLATVGTCSSEAYPKTIARLAGQQGLQAPAVCQQGCVGLAGAIEGSPAFIAAAKPDGGASAAAVEYLGPSGSHKQAKIDAALMPVYDFDSAGLIGDPGNVANLRLNSVENYIRYDVATLVAEHRRRADAKPITTVVLGCTHYPLAVAQIDAAFQRLRNYRNAAGVQPYADLIAEQITYVDPGEYTARELYRGLFLRKQLLRAGEECVLATDQCFVTVASPSLSADKKDTLGNLTAEYKYSRSAGDMTRADVLTVPMSSNAEAAAAVSAWFHKLPHVGRRFAAGER
ncbi:MAG: aspartate/glutamate racemase family protein [Planctomycetes bacterium]|nr:aspartate/glutamate racemase family protein [Planctomycetota bacterium]